MSRRRLPLLDGILPIDRARLPTEVIAGATLAALAMPEVMGYTKIAGDAGHHRPLHVVLPILAFALLGSSRHLVVGADSATAAVLAAGLGGVAAAGARSPRNGSRSPDSALMCGVLMIIARLLRLGFIANFLSHSVLIGFLTGRRHPGRPGPVRRYVRGQRAEAAATLQKFAKTLGSIPRPTSLPTLAVSVAVLVVILGLGRVNRKIPGALIAVVGMVASSYVFDSQPRASRSIGTVPGGLPAIGPPAITGGQASTT